MSPDGFSLGECVYCKKVKAIRDGVCASCAVELGDMPFDEYFKQMFKPKEKE